MKRFIPVLVALLLPLSLFAQGGGRGMGDDGNLLKTLGLTDSQIAQVQAVEKTARDAINADMTHIRLVEAQIADALLASTPDVQAINALIDKKGAYRVDMDKLRISERMQLLKIMGQDNYQKYLGYLKDRVRRGFGGGRMMDGRGWQGMMGNGGSPARP